MKGAPPLIAILVATACLVWNAWARSRVLVELQDEAERAGARLRVASSSGYFGTAHLHGVALALAAGSQCEAERVDVGYLPWHRFVRAQGVSLRLRGRLDTLWDDFRRIAWAPELDVEAAQLTYEAQGVGTFALSGVRHEAVPGGYRIVGRELRIGAMSWLNVSLLLSRPTSVVQLQMGPEPSHPRALGVSFVPSPGQGIEWTLNVPSQPFPEFAERAGFRASQSWSGATAAGTGSLVLPEAEGVAPRANLRFVIDGWHRPDWPEAALLTGTSGAIALRLAPSAASAPWLARAEVEAGLFSLVGTGELAFGDRPRLAFRASGERTCAQLAELLAPSSYRQRVRDYLHERRATKLAGDETVRLSLDAKLELAREAPPLRFRWRLSAGCGSSELAEP